MKGGGDRAGGDVAVAGTAEKKMKKGVDSMRRKG
jgi:hypothetical protein